MYLKYWRNNTSLLFAFLSKSIRSVRHLNICSFLNVNVFYLVLHSVNYISSKCHVHRGEYTAETPAAVWVSVSFLRDFKRWWERVYFIKRHVLFFGTLWHKLRWFVAFLSSVFVLRLKYVPDKTFSDVTFFSIIKFRCSSLFSRLYIVEKKT